MAMEKILTTSEEIRAIVKEAVAEVMTEFAKSSKPETPQKTSDILNLREAVTFLNENGYTLAECTLRNKVHRKELPYQKMGCRVIFSRKHIVRQIASLYFYAPNALDNFGNLHDKITYWLYNQCKNEWHMRDVKN